MSMVAKGSLPPCVQGESCGWAQGRRLAGAAPGPGDARGSKDLDEGAVVGVVIVGVAGDQDRAVAVDPGARVAATRQRVVRKDRPGRSPPSAADRRRRLRRGGVPWPVQALGDADALRTGPVGRATARREEPVLIPCRRVAAVRPTLRWPFARPAVKNRVAAVVQRDDLRVGGLGVDRDVLESEGLLERVADGVVDPRVRCPRACARDAT